MTLIRKPSILIFVLMTGLTSTVNADFGTWIHRKKMAYYRNTAWPDPFNEADAMQVVMPFEAMKRNGWRSHNTISAGLFRPGDGALLASGHSRVHWIATQSPESRREIYVQEGRNPEETAARVASVRESVAGMTLTGSQPQVLVTNIIPSTTPGNRATKINRDQFENMAAPKLPSTTASGQQGVAE